MSATSPCVFCGATATTLLRLPDERALCLPCTQRLGAMLQEDLRLRTVWPALVDEDDDAEPEPMVRLKDGSRVSLRERTEELKRDLTPEQRATLADDYVKMGLHHEALVELSTVLTAGEPAAGQRALQLLLEPPLGEPGAVDQVRPFLLPV